MYNWYTIIHFTTDNIRDNGYFDMGFNLQWNQMNFKILNSISLPLLWGGLVNDIYVYITCPVMYYYRSRDPSVLFVYYITSTD